MSVKLNTANGFNGRIYSRDDPSTCEVYGNGDRRTELTFDIHSPQCGVLQEEEGVFTNVVVVQHHPLIQRRGDKAVKLLCMFERKNLTVTNSFNMLIE